MKESFGERLRSLRQKKQMSQKDLAKRLGFSGQSIIAHYESNNKQPSHQTLSKIADILQVSVDYLLGRTDHPDFPPLNYLAKEADRLPEAWQELPPEAQEDVLDFIQFVKEKYKKKQGK